MTPEREELIRDLAAKLMAARTRYDGLAIQGQPTTEPERTKSMQEYYIAKARTMELQAALDDAMKGDA